MFSKSTKNVDNVLDGVYNVLKGTKRRCIAILSLEEKQEAKNVAIVFKKLNMNERSIVKVLAEGLLARQEMDVENTRVDKKGE